MTDADRLITTTEAARLLGVGSTGAARAQLARLGVTPAGRQPGRSGENLWSSQAIADAQTARRPPGRPRTTPGP